MIKNLKSRIFLLVMISLSAIIVGSIMAFGVWNYRNTIDSATSMMDRFVGRIDIKRNNEERPSNINIDPEVEVDGLYYILIENSKIINNLDTNYSNEISTYALRVSNKKAESGIIGKYVYKLRKVKDNSCMVIMLENTNVIRRARMILIIALISSGMSLVLIYVISKKISNVIVKPVEENLQRQKQFVSDASHELKTPLAVIEANADVLENEIGTNKWLGYIQNETESMNKLVNQLLLLAKMEDIESENDYEKLNVSNEVKMIVSMFESMAYEKQIKMIGNIQEDIFMTGNKQDLEHILSTLIDNAIKHTESEKKIMIELEKEKSNILLRIKNEGQPIPEEEREKIFERFYRIDKSRNRNEKRYGLGLAIAKSIVEKYKGKIEVTYEKGFTVFKIMIPNSL